MVPAMLDLSFSRSCARRRAPTFGPNLLSDITTTTSEVLGTVETSSETQLISSLFIIIYYSY